MAKNLLISIVIPAYNEEDSINPLTDSIIAEAKKIRNHRFEIVFIDDGSSDKTFKAMKAVMQKNKNFSIKAYSLVKNSGKTTALKVGIDKASGDFVMTMDADLQDDPSDFRAFITKMEEERVDLIVGNRINRYQKNPIKLISSCLVNKIMRKSFGYGINDMNCGYKLMSIDLARSLSLKSDYHRFIPLLALIRGYRIGEVNLLQRKRKFGKSKYGKLGVFRSTKFVIDFLNLLFICKFSENPFKLFGKSGLSLFGSGFLILVYLSVRWFMGTSIGGRPLFFLGILLLILGVNIISLGLLGELIVFGKIERKDQLIKAEEMTSEGK